MKIAILCPIALILMSGCAFYRGIDSGTRTYGLASASKTLPWPPGTSQTAIRVSKDAASPIRRTALVSPEQLVSLTCDFGDGPRGGVNCYWGKQAGIFTGMAAFPPTNVFALPLDTNTPSFIEVRSFVNWPAPGIVQTVTNDDGSTYNTTNFLYESAGASYVFVPTNCQSIALMNYPGRMEVVGWGSAGTVYHILGGSLDAVTNDLEDIQGTNSPWSHLVQAGEGPYFRSAW